MAISRLTAYIIASRTDIHVSSAFVAEGGKHCGWITLGADDRYRPLLNTEPIYDSAEEAERAMWKVVEEIRTAVANEGKHGPQADP